MDIRWLKTFIIASKYENFRKTSEDLYLTQPAITKHIKRLEEHLNIQLFERKGKTVTLTDAGFKFLPHAREIISKYEHGIDSFESWKQGYERKLVIAAAPQIASSFLPSLLRSFIDNHPDIEVIINVLNSFEMGDEISAGKADLGLTRLQPLQPDLSIDIIHEEPVIFVGPNGYIESTKLVEEVVLSQFRLITYNHPAYWDELLHEIKTYYPRVQTMAVNQVEVTKKFIEKGLGVSYLPLTMVKEDIEKKRLVQIHSEKIKMPISVTYLLTKVETSEVRTFTKFLKEAIKDI
ncbi:LysR family transcriptional regulator [Litchfieldia salsa]|uniref:LysR family transcriptional regulator, repressor for citA n=1 Tax=Litchfieldia salsa TaxID=930152 RepID=A0A1H0SV29_9BACI|nr:LysR family transcriptional regulator [Litchfieldia salsa]SDP45495.1 LysR family transcriptional regulator, repressor for citA [Litchfieldia salsa]